MWAIEDTVLSIGRNSLASYDLPEPVQNANEGQRSNREYTAEISHNLREITDTLRDCIPSLTEEQKHVLHRVCESTMSNLGEMFFFWMHRVALENPL